MFQLFQAETQWISTKPGVQVQIKLNWLGQFDMQIQWINQFSLIVNKKLSNCKLWTTKIMISFNQHLVMDHNLNLKVIHKLAFKTMLPIQTLMPISTAKTWQTTTIFKEFNRSIYISQTESICFKKILNMIKEPSTISSNICLRRIQTCVSFSNLSVV